MILTISLKTLLQNVAIDEYFIVNVVFVEFAVISYDNKDLIKNGRSHSNYSHNMKKIHVGSVKDTFAFESKKTQIFVLGFFQYEHRYFTSYLA